MAETHRSVTTVLGVVALTGVHLATAALTRSLSLPDGGAISSLLVLLALLGALSRAGPAQTDALVERLRPAEQWLVRNLGLFVMPLLVARARSLAAPASVLARALGVVVAGFAFTLVTSALIARALRIALDAPMQSAAPSPSKPPWALLALSIALGLLSRALPLHRAALALPLGLVVLLGAWRAAATIPARWRALFNPLLVATLATAGALTLAGVALPSLVTGSLARPAAGDVWQLFLGPSVVALGLELFRRRRWIAHHAPALSFAIAASALLSLVATALSVRLLGLPLPWRLALLTRSVTTPITVGLAAKLHADPSRAAAVVLVTGVIASVAARPWLTALGVRDAASRGIAVGSSGHALGTATLSAYEPDAAGVAALTFTLYGVVTALALSLPVTRAWVLWLAL